MRVLHTLKRLQSTGKVFALPKCLPSLASKPNAVSNASPQAEACIQASAVPRVGSCTCCSAQSQSIGLAQHMQQSGFHTSAACLAQVRASGPSRQARAAPSIPEASVRSNPGVGTIYVQCTKNNTICTLVDPKGMPLAWASAGSCGFKNARKKSTQVSQTVAETLVQRVLDRGYRDVRIVMKGLGYGKAAAVRAITKSMLRVLEIHEQTPIPHNGCRAPKRRRI